jgi:hypothetical protein
MSEEKDGVEETMGEEKDGVEEIMGEEKDGVEETMELYVFQSLRLSYYNILQLSHCLT